MGGDWGIGLGSLRAGLGIWRLMSGVGGVGLLVRTFHGRRLWGRSLGRKVGKRVFHSGDSEAVRGLIFLVEDTMEIRMEHRATRVQEAMQKGNHPNCRDFGRHNRCEREENESEL